MLAGAPQDLPAQGETSFVPLTSLTSLPDQAVGHRKCSLPGIRALYASTLADVFRLVLFMPPSCMLVRRITQAVQLIPAHVFQGAKWEIAVLAQQWRDHDLIEVCQMEDHADKAQQGGRMGTNKHITL